MSYETRVVPVEPTPPMWAAMGNVLVGYKRRHHDAVAAELWRAVLEAAPVNDGAFAPHTRPGPDNSALNNPSPPTPVLDREAGQFLVDRLREFENDVNERDFHGHVAPALARFEASLHPLQPPALSGGDVGEAFVAGYEAAYRDGGNDHTPDRKAYIRKAALLALSAHHQRGGKGSDQ